MNTVAKDNSPTTLATNLQLVEYPNWFSAVAVTTVNFPNAAGLTSIHGGSRRNVGHDVVTFSDRSMRDSSPEVS